MNTSSPSTLVTPSRLMNKVVMVVGMEVMPTESTLGPQ